MLELLLIYIATAYTGDKQAGWQDLLRDAQATNQALLQHGAATMDIRFTPGIGTEDIHILCEVVWAKDKFLQKFKLHGPPGEVLGREDTKKPLEEQQYDEILNTGKETLWYVPTQKLVHIHNIADKQPTDPLLHLNPMDLWMKCCPPQGAGGRPWREMIGLTAVGKDGARSELEFKQLEGGLVKQTRRDPGGGVMEMTFSMDQGGNVVETSYTHPDASRGYSKGFYKWRRVGKAFILESCSIDKKFSDAEAKLLNVAAPQKYSLNVREANIGPVDDKIFSKARFLATLPVDTKVLDHVKNTSYPVRPKALPTEDQFRSLSEELKTQSIK
jgi:hypothetical protein